MTTLGSIQVVKAVYDRLSLDAEVLEATLPRNSKDLMRGSLDCAVIRRLHSIIADNGHMPLDSVRGIFIEGGPLYPTAGFYEKTHIQIAIANPACIKGVFRVPEDQLRRWSPV